VGLLFFGLFLRGVLEKEGVWMWFFGGANVVGCVADVVFWTRLFGR
jgi:hypothetical protein